MRRIAAAALGLLAVGWLNAPAHADGDPLQTTLTGKDNAGRPDRLLVRTDPVRAGATVKLWRVKDGKRHLLDEGMVDFKGHCRFVVEDKNGKRRTTYVAKALATESTPGSLSNLKRVR